MSDDKAKTKKCFINAHCSWDCPNFQIDTANDKYGYGIADDMGLEEISCEHCHYNSSRCDDCLFENSKDCPEYKESEYAKDTLGVAESQYPNEERIKQDFPICQWWCWSDWFDGFE